MPSVYGGTEDNQVASFLEQQVLKYADATGVSDRDSHLNTTMGGSGDPFMFHLAVHNLLKAGLLTVNILPSGKVKLARVSP
jgi:hypothetical protein